MTRIVFLDTETTSLRPDRRAWEIGLIVREPTRWVHPDRPDTYEPTDSEHQWFIRSEDLDLGNADLMSLKIGRFHERHPQMTGVASRVPSEADVLAEVEKMTRGAHLVGAVPNFDAEVLGARMRAYGICPSWHYHLIDTEALAIGYLAARGIDGIQGDPEGATARIFDPRDLPWKSDDLSAALGIKISDEDRHTALGDAKWARAIYDKVTGHA